MAAYVTTLSVHHIFPEKNIVKFNEISQYQRVDVVPAFTKGNIFMTTIL